MVQLQKAESVPPRRGFHEFLPSSLIDHDSFLRRRISSRHVELAAGGRRRRCFIDDMEYHRAHKHSVDGTDGRHRAHSASFCGVHHRTADERRVTCCLRRQQ
jgi:hypothetical protein